MKFLIVLAFSMTAATAFGSDQVLENFRASFEPGTSYFKIKIKSEETFQQFWFPAEALMTSRLEKKLSEECALMVENGSTAYDIMDLDFQHQEDKKIVAVIKGKCTY